jgi:dTDP-4-dehydrorhamnose reductase
MIVLLGASGYVGTAFQRELARRGHDVIPLSRAQVDYTKYSALIEFLKDVRPSFLINAAGYTGRPNVDTCETYRADTLQGNTLLPLTISHACQATSTPWGHVSSGCIFNGAWVGHADERRIETDLMKPAVRSLLIERSDAVEGFCETDEPNFSFRRAPCSFYSGTKALAEEILTEDDAVYIWRLRIPFDEQDGNRNFLSKLQRYERVYDNFNSLSHLGDFVAACLNLWDEQAPPGIYNVTNPGYVSSREVAKLIQQMLRLDRTFDFWGDDEEFYRNAAKAPRSNCILSVSKLQGAGIAMRPVEDALRDALSHWQPETIERSRREHRPLAKQT